MLKRIILTLLFTFIFSNSLIASKPTLIFYCGITMIKPITQMAKIIEDKYDCKIIVSQGSSKDLYDSLKFSQKGDLYLPGSEAYRINNLKDGFLLDSIEIGFNQAAIFVQKGNPLNATSLDDFASEHFGSILCDPNAGSIGKMTKQILLSYKGNSFFDKAYDNSIEIGTDSRNLNKALIDKRADLTINWKATSFWDENSKYIDVIEIDEKFAPKRKLIISLLKFSENKEIAKAFMDFAVSNEGQEIMRKYGFL